MTALGPAARRRLVITGLAILVACGGAVAALRARTGTGPRAAATGGMRMTALHVPAAESGTFAGAASVAVSASPHAAPAPAGPAVPTVSGAGASALRRVEQTAQVTLRARRVGMVYDRASAMAVALGGYVQSSTLQTGGGQEWAEIVADVPLPAYGTFLTQVSALGRTVSTGAQGQDVTGQYVDLQGRLTALRAERASYMALLSRTNSIGDILQIQSALSEVETQLEQVTGQLRVISAATAMATVTVDIESAPKPAPVPVQPGLLGRLATALDRSLQALADGATGVGLALAWALPWGILAAAGWAAYRRWGRPAAPRPGA